MFVNKLDRAGASLSSSISSILAHRLHPAPTLLALPVASFDPGYYARGEPGIEGLVDLVKWEVWRWPTTQSAELNHKPERTPLPTTEPELTHNNPLFSPTHPLLSELLPAREALLDGLSLRSPELESAILECPPDVMPYLSVSVSQIMSSLRLLVGKREILPVFCGAAAKHIGTDMVLDYVGELLASPRDVRLEGAVEAGPEVQMLAWKVAWDKRKGWMTFVRVYSGMCIFQVTRQHNALACRLPHTEHYTRQHVYPRKRADIQDFVVVCRRTARGRFPAVWFCRGDTRAKAHSNRRYSCRSYARTPVPTPPKTPQSA